MVLLSLWLLLGGERVTSSSPKERSQIGLGCAPIAYLPTLHANLDCVKGPEDTFLGVGASAGYRLRVRHGRGRRAAVSSLHAYTYVTNRSSAYPPTAARCISRVYHVSGLSRGTYDNACTCWRIVGDG